MVSANLFVFCKIVTGLVFAISSISKLRDFPGFVESVHDFRLLPSPFVSTCAVLFLFGEVSVVGLLFIRPWLGFLLAAILLTAFSAALASVVIRKVETRCNCFGASQQMVSPADLMRNGGFLACSLCGLWLAVRLDMTEPIAPLNVGIASFAALVFVLIWMQASEIYRLFQPQ